MGNSVFEVRFIMQKVILFDVFAPFIYFIFICDTSCRVMKTYNFTNIDLNAMISFAPLFDLIAVRFKDYNFRSSLILAIRGLYA